MTGPADDPVPVDQLLARLDAAIAPVARTAVSGTLTGWKTRRGSWAHGELVTDAIGGDGITARLPLVSPPAVTHTARRRHGDQLASGPTVLVHGRVEIGDRWNPLRLVADRIDVTSTISPTSTARHALVGELSTSGAAARNKVLRVPTPIRRIGLVSPASGEAGRADFLQTLARSPNPVLVLERRPPMSGPNAPDAIAGAIRELDHLAVDAIVICRGGGAATDLATFDAMPVATAIVQSERPVIIAVGHTTDHSVADLVAHTSVATPTAAAAWIHRHNEQKPAAIVVVPTARPLVSDTDRRRDPIHQRREQIRVAKRRRQARLAGLAVAGFIVLAVLAAIVSRWP
jgi:exodeoxyribonuclease VII large subunit